MSAPLRYTPLAAGATDASDPNTSEPADNRLFYPSQRNDAPGSSVYVIASTQQITIQLWAYVPEFKRWCKLGAATACPADTLTYLPVIPPSSFSKLFPQVTINSSNCPGFVVGLQGAR